MSAGDVILLVCAVPVIVWIWRDAINRPSPGDADSFTRKDERCQTVEVKQAIAVQRMKRLGHTSLLEGKPYVPPINYVAPLKKPSVTVVSIKRGKK